MPCPVQRRRAYTLIELLAVVVLLALLASLALPALVRAAGSDPLDQAVAALRGAEHQLRVLSVGAATQAELGAAGFTGHRLSAGHGESATLVELRLEPALELTWNNAHGNALTSIAFDHRGRSEDLEVTVRAGSRQRRFRIAGISGEWRDLDAEHDP
jgi:prepilin-type N-terminal cleavage/methylation domain-containing protein